MIPIRTVKTTPTSRPVANRLVCPRAKHGVAQISFKTIRAHRHLRTMRSALSSTGPMRDRWPRIQETERLQREGHRLQQTQKSSAHR